MKSKGPYTGDLKLINEGLLIDELGRFYYFLCLKQLVFAQQFCYLKYVVLKITSVHCFILFPWVHRVHRVPGVRSQKVRES